MVSVHSKPNGQTRPHTRRSQHQTEGGNGTPLTVIPRHWDKKTVKDIVSDIAKDHGLTAKIDGKVGAHTYEWFGQEEESDITSSNAWRDVTTLCSRSRMAIWFSPRAGAPLIYAGVRPELDGIQFIIKTATRTISKNGYTTQVEAKLGDEEEGGLGKLPRSRDR